MLNNPQQKRVFNEAIDQLHASSDLYDRVMQQAQSGKRTRRGTAKPLAVVTAGALALTVYVGGGAYVAGHVEVIRPLIETFFPSALGDHGMGDASEWRAEGAGAFKREYDSIDPTELDGELSGAMQPVNLSVNAHGFTLTVHDMIIDENACGIVRFTLTNPEGIELKPEYGEPNEMVFYAENPLELAAIGMDDADGNFLDQRCLYDSDTLTETSVDGTMYFTPIWGELDQAKEAIFTGVSWELSWYDPNACDSDECSASTDLFVPGKVVGTRAFSDSDDASASLSPYGICYAVKQKGESELVLDRMVVSYTDGTHETLIDHTGDTKIENTYVKAGLGRYSVCVFTKSVDVKRVASITLEGRRNDSDSPSGMETVLLELTPDEESEA